MEQEIILSHEGASEREALDWMKPLIFQGSTRLYDKTRDPARSILNSTVIPPAAAQDLAAIRGKCLLTQVHGVLRHAHIFSTMAEFVDGLERIGYLEHKHDMLLVKEYNGSKTANYSAYYPLLCEQLRNAGFPEIEDKVFQVPEGWTARLAALINQIIQWREEGRLVLEPVQEIDSISFMKKRRYYYKAFWRMQSAETAPVVMEPECESEAVGEREADAQKQIVECLIQIADEGRKAGTTAELEAVEEKVAKIRCLLDFVEQSCQNQRTYLEWRNEIRI